MYSCCFDFHLSIFRSIQLMTVFLPGFQMNFYLLTGLSTSRNTVGQPVMSGKFDGGALNKHQNTGQTDQQNSVIRLT